MNTAGRYASGIGTGAAAGAATGSVFGPWGTLIGGVVGAGAGAVGAGFAEKDARVAERKLKQDQERRRRQHLISVLRNQAAGYGIPMDDLDAMLEAQGMERQEGMENEAFAASQELDPNAFVGMAQNGLTAANNTYKSFQPTQLQQQAPVALPGAATVQGSTAYQQLQQQRLNEATAGANPYQLQRPRWMGQDYGR